MTVVSLEEARRRASANRDPETGLRLPADYRRTIHDSGTMTIRDIAASHERPPTGATSLYQVVVPYLGVFTYSVGRRSTLVDANRTLMVPADIEFTDSHPVRNVGHAAVAVAPAVEVMEELCRLHGARPAEMFRELSRPAVPGLGLAAHRLRILPEEAALEVDELAIQVLQAVFGGGQVGRGQASRVVERAKQVIHERGCGRLSLADIARAVGVSPVYLTQEFTRSEGMPLYRYQLQLRLSRALVELPDCEDITGLALDLGFSSHSHFGEAFRRTFGLTPAAFRASSWAENRRLGPGRRPAPCRAAAT
ncbi:AraC family transcriptional regulator [Caulobacter segnis]|uniref:helix-turn-helix transcriptional regulator n=1 Tax=Caulobacter segnis TaxID=88688 RepID=UPI0024105B92|nr:AraC family transcriptional regulator [Caulobacter segnis]MDG2519939.1 AraC family transcriptional regulator [Caulobacter segnis]